MVKGPHRNARNNYRVGGWLIDDNDFDEAYGDHDEDIVKFFLCFDRQRLIDDAAADDGECGPCGRIRSGRSCGSGG